MFSDCFEWPLILKKKPNSSIRLIRVNQILPSCQFSSLGDQWKDLCFQLINAFFSLNTWIGFVLNLKVPVDVRCLKIYICLQGGRSAQLTVLKRQHRPQLCPSLHTARTWHCPLAMLETAPIFSHPSIFPLPSHNTFFLVF